MRRTRAHERRKQALTAACALSNPEQQQWDYARGLLLCHVTTPAQKWPIFAPGLCRQKPPAHPVHVLSRSSKKDTLGTRLGVLRQKRQKASGMSDPDEGNTRGERWLPGYISIQSFFLCAALSEFLGVTIRENTTPWLWVRSLKGAILSSRAVTEAAKNG